MTTGNLIKILVLIGGLGIAVTAMWYAKDHRAEVLSLVMPGRMTAAHGFLENNCSACHTPIIGVDDTKCISCHANNPELLERQPTAFHGGITNCAVCHIEHRGREANIRTMDHEALARIGLNTTIPGDVKKDDGTMHPLLPGGHPLVSSLEARLDCASCHATKDRHFGLFGTNCASCHATAQWTIPGFQHPSPRSTECAQCHQAPPSHYMEHFEMVDKSTVARRSKSFGECCENVRVSECYICHQTTSWNDIKGIGFYKHH